jgi:hypothetical protein
MAQRKKKDAAGPKKPDKAGKPEDPDDEIIVVCHPVGLTTGVPGSRRLECSGCKQMVWLSRATEEQVTGKPYRVLCDECVSKETDDDIQLMPVSEGQIAEMLAAIPGITRADILKKFPTRSPSRRRAALETILKEARKRRRSKN